MTNIKLFMTDIESTVEIKQSSKYNTIHDDGNQILSDPQLTILWANTKNALNELVEYLNAKDRKYCKFCGLDIEDCELFLKINKHKCCDKCDHQ
jgi:hypothetical protein